MKMTTTLQPLTEPQRTEIQAVVETATARLAVLNRPRGKGQLCWGLERTCSIAENVLETSASYERTINAHQERSARHSAILSQMKEFEERLKSNEAKPLTATVPTVSLRQAIAKCE